MYKLTSNEFGEPEIVIRINDGLYIPMTEGNRHYQEYLEWVAEGNTPEEAE